MAHSETQPRHPTMSDAQAALVPALVEGHDPDAWVVITVGDLSDLLRHAWSQLERERRQITESRHAFRLMRMLSAGDFIVDTKHQREGGQQ